MRQWVVRCLEEVHIVLRRGPIHALHPPGGRPALLAGLGCLCALSACSEFGVQGSTTEAPEALLIVSEAFVQAALPAVDVLLVIDDTASMEQEQEALAQEFARFTEALGKEQISWQLGVVTTDMSGDQAGWLRGSPYVITASTPDAASAVAERVQTGTGGSAPEAGLAAALLALELAEPGAANVGFRREHASLHVIVVSDSDDHSEKWLGGDPAGVFIAELSTRGPEPDASHLSAVVGDVPMGCASELGSAQPGTTYAEVAQATGGVVLSICTADVEGLLDSVTSASLSWPTLFELRELPEPGSVRVAVDGERVEEGWAVQLNPVPAIRFDTAPPPESVLDVWYLAAGEQS